MSFMATAVLLQPATPDASPPHSSVFSGKPVSGTAIVARSEPGCAHVLGCRRTLFMKLQS